ncbi:MAG: type II toxin-antitoxin system HicB family antitoxin [Calditrichaeota bacterium]|nr:MAG: type II toxin-antitoxin system HicB family antitoxin [Calditrichota bacterium]
MKLRIVIRKVEKDLYIGSCPNLEGCHIEASSEEEARKILKAAINAYLLSYKQRHEKIPYKS